MSDQLLFMSPNDETAQRYLDRLKRKHEQDDGSLDIVNAVAEVKRLRKEYEATGLERGDGDHRDGQTTLKAIPSRRLALRAQLDAAEKRLMDLVLHEMAGDND